MDSTVAVWILAWAGVAAIALNQLTGLVEQLRRLVISWRALMRAARGEQELEANASSHRGAEESNKSARSTEGVDTEPPGNRPAPPASDQ